MISIGSDHAGYDLKEYIKEVLKSRNLEFKDFGPESPDSVDYPEYGYKVSKSVSEGQAERGILVCGSGIGMSIVANKVENIRAALCLNPEQASLCRQHNNANVVVLAGRMTDEATAKMIINNWLDTEFEGGRHQKRIDLIHSLSGK